MRNNAILIIKALAIIGVVFHHLANRRFDPEVVGHLKTLQTLSGWCVLAFIATAGWLHALSETKKNKGLGSFILYRSRRLLLPFALLTCLYAGAWQIIQTLQLSEIGARLPYSYWSKILRTIPGENYEPVAEQLYFLPLLFLLASCTQAAKAIADTRGILTLACAGFIMGLTLEPEAPNTGASCGMLLWGQFSYAGGFLIQQYNTNKWKWPSLAIISTVLISMLGPSGVLKSLPLIMLGGIQLIETSSTTFLHRIGEASGTIYAYHTPFILQPLLILCAAMPNYLQLSAALGAAFIAIAICTIAHSLLKTTRAKRLLL